MAGHGHLLIGLPAVAVLVAAVLLFEGSAKAGLEYAEMVRKASAWTTVGWERVLEEARARYTWYAVAALDLFTGAFATAYCGRVIFANLSGRNLAVGVASGGVLIALGLGMMVHAAVAELPLNRIIFAFTYDALSGSGRYSAAFLGQVAGIISAINIFAVVAPVVALLAVCSALAPEAGGRRDDLDALADRSQRLRESLNVAAALMVAGILHMGGWLRWPASLLADKAMRAGVVDVALAVTLFWGMALSAVIVAAYVPAASLLRVRALRLMRAHGGIAEPARWLSDHGLDLSPARQLPQLAAMLAPLVAGPLSSLFSSFAGALH